MFLRIVLALSLITGHANAFSLDAFINSSKPFPKVKKVNEVRSTDRRKKECSALTLRYILENQSFQKVQAFFDYCDQRLNRRTRVSLLAEVGFTTWAYEKKERFNEITFNLANGEVLKGILALKESSKALPLVVIRTGIYGRADFSFTNSTSLLSYFEHAPYHVLLLENGSNEDYVTRNGKIRLGGLSGGQQILDAMAQIQSSRFGRKFSEFHLTGFSLGAHDSLYANIFSNHSKIKFRSVTALCPALDLEPSIKNVFDQPVIGGANSNYLLRFMERQWQTVVALQRVIAFPFDRNRLDRSTVRDAVVNAAAAQLALDRTMIPAPISQRISTTSEFLKLSRFPTFSKHIQTPTYIIQALDDSVTPYKVNLGKYIAELKKTKNKYVNTLTLPQGEHCAYNAKYGLDVMSSVITGIVKKHSRFANPQVLVSAPASLQKASNRFFTLSAWPTGRGYQVADYKMTDLHQAGGRLMAEITFSFFNPRGSSNFEVGEKVSCDRFHYWNAPQDCKHQFVAEIPASIVGINDRPDSQEAFAAISRFNVTTAILDSSKQEILGGQNPPQYFYLPKLVLQDGFY